MKDNEYNLNPVITIADRYQIRLPSDKHFADIQEDFGFPSICPKEKLCRKIYSQLTVLEELTHIDNIPAKCLMVTIPRIRTREQRDYIATLLNKPIFLEDGTINIHSASVSISLKSVIVLVELRGIKPLDQFLGGMIIQMVNDCVEAVMCKFTNYAVDETQTNVLGVIGSLGDFDGSNIGIETYRIIYENSQIITLVYLDQNIYTNKMDYLKVASQLVQNSLNRFIMFCGKPCSCIAVNEAQISASKHNELMELLDKWERCLGYSLALCSDELAAEDLESLSSEKNQGRREHHNKNELVQLRVIAKRGSQYQYDAAVDLEKRISRYLCGDTQILENTPSSPQDLILFQLKISNMSTYSCVKSIEAILREQGSYQIEIDLASGIVEYVNTEQSIFFIVQSIKDAGFGCMQVLKEEQTDLVNQIDIAAQNQEYTKFWTSRIFVTVAFFVIINLMKLIFPREAVVSIVSTIISIIMILINYPIMISGLTTAMKRERWLPETSFALITVAWLIYNVAMFIVLIINRKNKAMLRELSSIDLANGTTAILSIVCLARLIESIGKKNAIKQFQGLAETLPSDIYVVKNLKLDQLVEQFNNDQQTVEYSQIKTTQLRTKEEADVILEDRDDRLVIPDCIPRSDSFSVAYTDVLRCNCQEDISSLINSDVLEKILTTLSLKQQTFDIDSYNNNELAQEHPIETVKLASLLPGQVVLVFPGEIIPCDGYIIYGHSPIDESIVSMRHHGIAKGPENKVYAGTKVLSSELFICACAVGQETLLGYLISSVRRSTMAANTKVHERDDLQTTLLHGEKNFYKTMNNVMFWYRPIILILSVIITIIHAIDFFLLHKLDLSNIYYYSIVSKMGENFGKIVALLTIFSCLQMIAQPFAYQLCEPLCSLVGTDRFAKESIIVRDCAKVCQKLSEIKVIAFPRSGGLTYGKPLITDLNMFIELDLLLDNLPTEYEFQGDGSALIKFDNYLFRTKEEFIQYLENINNFNAVLASNEKFKQLLINRCVSLLSYISSLMIAQQNSIMAGVFTTIKTLQDQKYTKYYSKPSSLMRSTIPVISSYSYDSDLNIIQGRVIQNNEDVTIKIVSTFGSPEDSANGEICVNFSNLVAGSIQIQAVAHVDADDCKNNDHFHLLLDDQHKLEFTISDKLREEAGDVVRELQRMGYKTILTSTDSTDFCEISARQTGIPADCVYSNLLFDEKPHLLAELGKQLGSICYICDGVNDLSCTNSVLVSIAVSDGRDGIKAASDFVSLKCTLADTIKIIKLARGIRKQLVTSQLVAGALTIILIPFCAGVLLLAGTQVYIQYIAICIAAIGIIVLLLSQSFLNKLLKQLQADGSADNSTAETSEDTIAVAQKV